MGGAVATGGGGEFMSLESSKASVYSTGEPRPKETAPTSDHSVGLCLGPYGGPRGVLFLMSEIPLYQQAREGAEAKLKSLESSKDSLVGEAAAAREVSFPPRKVDIVLQTLMARNRFTKSSRWRSSSHSSRARIPLWARRPQREMYYSHYH